MLNKAKYLIKVLEEMNYKKLFDTAFEISEKTKKSKAHILFDIIYCGLKYEAGYNDYKLYKFYELYSSQRATYVTRGINNKLVKYFNDPKYYGQFADKLRFNRIFREFIKRDYLDVSKADFETFEKFMGNKETVILKPKDASCGEGVENLSKNEFSSLNEMYLYVKKSDKSLLEEYITEHNEISKIYPYSVNTYRITTILKDKKADVIYAFIRIGNKGKSVDNINAGGMAAPIDIETGEILYPAYDKNGNVYDVHPMTMEKITGTKLPYWKEAVEMCKEAAQIVPQIKYVGWDVAVTENGPLLVEGNHFPGHDIIQLPPHTPNRIGMLPKFKEYTDAF